MPIKKKRNFSCDIMCPEICLKRYLRKSHGLVEGTFEFSSWKAYLVSRPIIIILPDCINILKPWCISVLSYVNNKILTKQIKAILVRSMDWKSLRQVCIMRYGLSIFARSEAAVQKQSLCIMRNVSIP